MRISLFCFSQQAAFPARQFPQEALGPNLRQQQSAFPSTVPLNSKALVPRQECAAFPLRFQLSVCTICLFPQCPLLKQFPLSSNLFSETLKKKPCNHSRKSDFITPKLFKEE